MDSVISLVEQNSAVLMKVSKSFRGVCALKDVSLTLMQGSIIGLMGPNGSGKTTMIKLMAGLIRDYQGTISICGATPGQLTNRLVSYLPDRVYFPMTQTVDHGVRFFAEFYEDFNLDKCLYMLGRFNLSPQNRLNEMSKGMVEKYQLCLTMSREAKLYLLDEPLGGVDPAARDFVLDTILDTFDEKGTILIATHLVADIERIFDTIIFLKDGSVERFGSADVMRERAGKTIDGLFREVFSCTPN